MDEMKAFYDSLEGKSIVELSTIMNDISIKLEEAITIKTDLQKKYDAIRLNALPSAMDEEGVTGIKVDGVGRVGLTSDLYASIIAEKKPQAYKWLRDNGHGGAIQETVNSGTLKAIIKVILKKGEVVPPQEFFKVTPFTRASITKK